MYKNMQEKPGTCIVQELGNENCIELFNMTTRVVLEPNLGGRILVYALNGNNVLWINQEDEGTPYLPGRPYGHPSAGRFDIGPEKTGHNHQSLFMGKWEGQITGAREAELLSPVDAITGIRLRRLFRLEETGTHLSCTQEILNQGRSTVRQYHWSRTLVKGGGISLTPLNPHSRYPKGYLVYGPDHSMDFDPPEEPNLRTRNGVLEIVGEPVNPKFVMDCAEGWLAYITTDHQLFIKKFQIYPDRPYGDMAAPTASVWYHKDTMCEIEPLGPLEVLEPGESSSFTEHWYLYDFEYPADLGVDLGKIKSIIRTGP